MATDASILHAELTTGYSPESGQGFAPLLDFLWIQAPTWWAAFTQWDDFLEWANDQHGTRTEWDAEHGFTALDSALDFEASASSADKYTRLQQILTDAWGWQQQATGADPAERRAGLQAIGTVKDLGEAYRAYRQDWQYTYDGVDQVYLWRAADTEPWNTKLPPYAQARARYTGIAAYGDNGWWYGMDTSARDWRYLKTDGGKPTGNEDPTRWLTYEEFEKMQAASYQSATYGSPPANLPPEQPSVADLKRAVANTKKGIETALASRGMSAAQSRELAQKALDSLA